MLYGARVYLASEEQIPLALVACADDHMKDAGDDKEWFIGSSLALAFQL